MKSRYRIPGRLNHPVHFLHSAFVPLSIETQSHLISAGTFTQSRIWRAVNLSFSLQFAIMVLESSQVSYSVNLYQSAVLTACTVFSPAIIVHEKSQHGCDHDPFEISTSQESQTSLPQILIPPCTPVRKSNSSLALIIALHCNDMRMPSSPGLI